MSHFNVLVIGPDPERQLQPFHEFECTGTDDEFVQDIDITADVQSDIDSEDDLQKGLACHGLDERQVASEADLSEKHKYGYAIIRDGKLIKAVDRTNPNKKWDWYRLGGRWRGMLLCKNGQEVDQAEVRDVDFRGMRDRAEARVVALYRHARALFGDAPEPRTWEAVRAEHGDDTGAARKAFHGQDAYRIAAKDDQLRWLAFEGDLHEFWWPESRHVFRARKQAFCTFAVLRDGNWYERGRMGWWGVVFNEKDESEWVNQFETLVESLAPDTLISIYDCHI